MSMQSKARRRAWRRSQAFTGLQIGRAFTEGVAQGIGRSFAVSASAGRGIFLRAESEIVEAIRRDCAALAPVVIGVDAGVDEGSYADVVRWAEREIELVLLGRVRPADAEEAEARAGSSAYLRTVRGGLRSQPVVGGR